jgi:hypothetical protein
MKAGALTLGFAFWVFASAADPLKPSIHAALHHFSIGGFHIIKSPFVF